VGRTHSVLFDRIECFRLESCFEYRERPTPTFKTVQIDHLFVSRELVPRLSPCWINVRDLSNHRAVVVDLAPDT
jgi:exonuclease III